MTKYLTISGIGTEGYRVAVIFEDTLKMVSSVVAPNLEVALVKAFELSSAHPVVLSQEIGFTPNPQDQGREETFRKSLSGLSKLVNKSLLSLYSSLG